jgi:hypothetical protein
MQRYLFTREGDIAPVDTERPTRVFTPEGQSIIAAARLHNHPGLISAIRQRDYKRVDRIISDAKVKLQKQGVLQRKRDRQNRRPLSGNRELFPLPKR